MPAFGHESAVADLLRDTPHATSVNDPEHLPLVISSAERLLERYGDHEMLHELDRYLAERRESPPIILRLATKLAISARLVTELPPSTRVSVVFAVYNEHQRILPPAQHPDGEDFLVRKLEQLHWLLDRRPDIAWEMLVVDDGCPAGSGRIAERIVTEQDANDRVRVLYLADAIETGLPVTAPLRSTDESRKGGSILYGMWEAAREHHENHVIVFTDADLSTHLGQTGLLLHPILNEGRAAAIGSRRSPTSVAIKHGMRERRGKLFIYLWKRLIPVLAGILDTQCGFKAFRAEVIREAAERVEEKGFAFDIELLTRVELGHPGAIAVVPIAWIDSEALSTTPDLQPYLSMLRAVARLYRTSIPRHATADAFADLIESLDEDAWERLRDNVPDEIADRDAAELADLASVSAGHLASLARKA